MNAEILRGFTDAIILNILNKEDSYGYKISKSIKELTNNYLDIKEATIYFAFKRMVKDNYITSYWTLTDSGVKRKYYKITKMGKIYLQDKIKEWRNNRSILNILLLGGSNER